MSQDKTLTKAAENINKVIDSIPKKQKSDTLYLPIYPSVNAEVKPYAKRGRGHPTKYQKELTIAQTFEYLDECKDKYVEVNVLTEAGEIARRRLYKYEIEEGMKEEDAEPKTRTINRFQIPSIAGLAKFLGVSRETIYNWEKENTEYFDTLSILRVEQETALITGGVSGQYNPNIVTLIMKKEHGYTEKIDLTTQGESINYNNDKTNEIIAARQRRTGGK